MKKIILSIGVLFMACTMTMAQGERRGPKDGERKMDPKEHAEKMTERMAKEYSLTETQKQQLLDIHIAMAEKKGDRPEGRIRGEHRRGPKGDGKQVAPGEKPKREPKGERPAEKKGEKKDRPEITKEQREEMHAKMKEVREAYDADIKNIFTDEQYKQFKEKETARQDKMKERRKKA